MDITLDPATLTAWGLAIPFAGTTLGAALVFLMRGQMSRMVTRVLTGFAAGVMVAASIWSLIVPAIEDSSDLGRMAWLPAFVGFWAGILFLLALDHVLPHLHLGESDTEPEGLKSRLERTTLMVLAVTIHNIPEGMAVGVVYAGLLAGGVGVTAAGALALSPRARSSPCRCAPRGRAEPGPFLAASSRAWSSPSARWSRSRSRARSWLFSHTS